MNKPCDMNMNDHAMERLASSVEAVGWPQNMTVVGRETLCDSVISLTLRRDDGFRAEWSAGAHVAIDVPEVSGTRHYSIYDSTAEGDLKIAVRRNTVSRAASNWLHENAQIGSKLIARGIRNNFSFRPGEQHLFIAGGIGITPLLPMMEYCIRAGKDYRLVYCGRTKASMPFISELEGRNVVVHESEAAGRIDLTAMLSLLDAGTHIYACGPNEMLDELSTAAKRFGHSDRLHVEHFGPLDSLSHDSDNGFEVVCARSCRSVWVQPQQTLLEALRGAGIEIESQCEQGVCGACETKVLAGTPDHRDSILSEQEKREGSTMMPCVSRSFGETLRLDI